MVFHFCFWRLILVSRELVSFLRLIGELWVFTVGILEKIDRAITVLCCICFMTSWCKYGSFTEFALARRRPHCSAAAANERARVPSPLRYHAWLNKNVRHHLHIKASIQQTTFSNTFYRIKIVAFWFKFHWNLFAGVQSTKGQHWFR